MVDISKILIVQRKNLQEQALQVLEMAEAEGFEPPWAFTPKLFSRQPRYDRFDMPPYRRNMKLVFTPKKCDFRNALEKSNAGKKNPRKSVMPYRILEDEASKQDKISRPPRYDHFDNPP